MVLGKQPYRRLMKLEAIRGVMAVYVFLHHFVHGSPELATIAPYFVFGQFALMIFFILSGFVIYYATVYRNPDISFRDYFLRRIMRIYPGFVVVLALTWIIKCIDTGSWLDPGWDILLGNLLQLQDKSPAAIVQPYWQNMPLWSLAYEWWFYMIFFPFWRLTRNFQSRQLPLVFGLSVLGFLIYTFVAQNLFALFLSYFLLWWVGLEIGKEWTETGRVTFKRLTPSLLFVGVMTLLWTLPAYRHYQAGNELIFANHPYVIPRHFLSVFIVLLIGYAWYRLRWIGFRPVFMRFTAIAPITYIVYILHFPVLLAANRHRPTGSVWLDLLGTSILIFGLAWIIEQPFQKWAVRQLKKWWFPKK